MKSLKSSLKSSKTRATEEQQISWELDGGGYSIVDQVVLFNGQLYDSESAAIRAILRNRTRLAAFSMLSFILPLIAMYYDRA